MKPDTQAADVVTAEVYAELIAVSLYNASNQDWNEAADWTRQLYRGIARKALDDCCVMAELSRLRGELAEARNKIRNLISALPDTRALVIAREDALAALKDQQP